MAEFALKVPDEAVKECVTNEIRAAILRGLGTNPERLIQAVVDTAMKQKRYSYDSETIFESMVNEAIRHAAHETFKEWLGEKKDVIRAAIIKRLKTEESHFFETVADQLVEGLGKSFTCHVALSVSD